MNFVFLYIEYRVDFTDLKSPLASNFNHIHVHSRNQGQNVKKGPFLADFKNFELRVFLLEPSLPNYSHLARGNSWMYTFSKLLAF